MWASKTPVMPIKTNPTITNGFLCNMYEIMFQLSSICSAVVVTCNVKPIPQVSHFLPCPVLSLAAAALRRRSRIRIGVGSKFRESQTESGRKI
jgi:hypothetical protein